MVSRWSVPQQDVAQIAPDETTDMTIPSLLRIRHLDKTSPATVIAVIMSAALVCLSSFLHVGVGEAAQRAVRTAINDADVVITSSGPSSAMSQIAATAAVDRIEEQVYGVTVTDAENPLAVAVQTIPSTATLTLIEGRFPEDPSEVLLIEVPATPTRYATGTQLEFRGENGVTHNVTVAGRATAAAGAVEKPSIPTLLGSAATAHQLLGAAATTRLLVYTTGNAEAVAAEIQDALAADVSVSSGEAYVADHAADFALGSRTILLALTLVTAAALLAGLMVIANNYQIQLVRSLRQIALLRSIGALRRQVFAQVLAQAGLTGALGALGGIVVGTILGGLVLHLLPTTDGLPLTPTPIILALTAGVIPCLLAALRPAVQATRVAPVAALREAPVERPATQQRARMVAGFATLGLGVGLTVWGGIDSSLGLVLPGAVLASVGLVLSAPAVFTSAAAALARYGGLGLRQASAQIARNPGRSGVTGIAVWLGTTLMVSLVVASATAQATLTDGINGATPTDIFVTPSEDAAQLADQIQSLPTVAASTTVQSLMVDATFDAQSRPLTVVAWTPQLADVLRTETTIAQPEPGTMILPPTPDAVDGDQVRLDQDGQTTELTVRIVAGSPMVGIVAPEDLSAFDVPLADVWVKLAPGAEPVTALEEIGNLPGVLYTSSPAVQRASIVTTLRQANLAGGAFLAVALAISMVGLANTIGVSVAERSREIGLFRALGALRSQVRRMVVTETLMLAAVAVSLGVVSGLLFGACGARAVLGEEQLVVSVHIPWLLVAALMVTVVGCAGLAAVIPARKAAGIVPVAAISKA